MKTFAVRWRLAYSDWGGRRVPPFNTDMLLFKEKKLKTKGLVAAPWRQSWRWRLYRHRLRPCCRGAVGGGRVLPSGRMSPRPHGPSHHPGELSREVAPQKHPLEADTHTHTLKHTQQPHSPPHTHSATYTRTHSQPQLQGSGSKGLGFAEVRKEWFSIYGPKQTGHANADSGLCDGA